MSELPLIGSLRGPDQIREDILRTFGDEEEDSTRFAVRWAWDHRRIQGMSQERAAEIIGIKAPHFSNILSGKKYLPPHKINAYEWVVGNKAVSGTIDRFAKIREQQMVDGIARIFAEQMVRAA